MYVCVQMTLGYLKGKVRQPRCPKKWTNIKEERSQAHKTRGAEAAEVRALVAIPLSQAPHCNLCLTGHRRGSGDIPWARGNATQ